METFKFIDIIFCIPIIQDVIEHLICDGDLYEDYNAVIAAKLANVHTLEIKGNEMLLLSNIILNACVLGTLRDITFRFRGYQPSILERELQNAHQIQRLQQRILDLSPKSVTFDVDVCGNSTRQMFLSAAELTKNTLKESFPKVFGQGMAKIVVVEGKYKFILAHT